MNDNIANPVIMTISDNREALDSFETSLRAKDEKTQVIIRSYPTVYIHNWKKSGYFEVYVGESNDIFKRTRQHYDAVVDENGWQHNLQGNDDAKLYIIGHEHFNKSLTLDIENRLMHYMMSVSSVKHVHNLRTNPQSRYYPINEMEDILRKIWECLSNENKELFPAESKIKDSAIYKASPLHKLTEDQEKAKDLIIEKVTEAIDNDRKQLIFIDGEAGTGKTVLNSSTFYELYCQAEERNKKLSCYLLVNHNEQITIYKQIADKLGLTEKYGEVVSKPTPFINSHKTDIPVDVAFVDEAHLLLTQGRQAYRGKNQLQDIIDRSKVTVVMFDENQILSTEQYWESKLLEGYRKQAKNDNNYMVLDKQLRMQVNEGTMDWINSFTKECQIKPIPKDLGGYSLIICKTPEELDEEIKAKATNSDSKLSRIIATYDWPYSSNNHENSWEVTIGKWHKPWNRELERTMTSDERRAISGLAWAEQPQTIDEVGSTFTIQGFDLNYAGVILGPSVKYQNGKIVFDPEASHNTRATRYRTLSDGTRQQFGQILLQHEVRVLMTRGVNGMYIYACDPELQKALLEAQNK